MRSPAGRIDGGWPVSRSLPCALAGQLEFKGEFGSSSTRARRIGRALRLGFYHVRERTIRFDALRRAMEDRISPGRAALTLLVCTPPPLLLASRSR